MNANAQMIAEPAATVAESGQYLTFLLGAELFAIGILAIKEIIEFNELTTVPMMPSCIRGVINLRGAVVPVVDLAARFGREPTATTRRTCIVIVEVQDTAERLVVGVIVDAVNEVLEIAPSEIEPAPTFGTRIRTDFIRGMGKVGGKFVVILAVNRILALDDVAGLEGLQPNGELADAAKPAVTV